MFLKSIILVVCALFFVFHHVQSLVKPIEESLRDTSKKPTSNNDTPLLQRVQYELATIKDRLPSVFELARSKRRVSNSNNNNNLIPYEADIEEIVNIWEAVNDVLDGMDINWEKDF
ncbi:hypothetical protein HMI54_004269 [Coelomomyces lativittatus]|nr:hypothetical protein HMI54_004269 [Coelomomyces lativittatus]